jgi:hypothetical protein
MYLNLDPDYFTHPKTVRLAGLLGPGADILPIRLWAYCAKHHPVVGALNGYSARELEAVIGWQGPPGKAVEGLVKVGFLKNQPEGYLIHDWKDHEGHIVAFTKRAKHANKIRWEKLRRDPSRSPQRAAKDSFKESPSFEDGQGKEGKARMGFIKGGIGKGGKRSPRSGSFEDAAADAEFVAQLKKAYPTVNVAQEIEKMRAWIRANPAKAKKNWRRFAHSWINHAQKEQEEKRGGATSPEDPRADRAAKLDALTEQVDVS